MAARGRSEMPESVMGAATQNRYIVGVPVCFYSQGRHIFQGNVSPHPLKIASDARFPSKTCRRLA